MIHLLPALATDAEELAVLARDGFVTAFGHLYEPDQLAGFIARVYSPESVAAEIADHGITHCLATDGPDGPISGFCKLRHPSAFAGHSTGHNAIEIGQLYTHPARTGEGIGARLMDWAIAEANRRNCDTMLLSVWSENFGAQRFYQRYGFRHIADIHFWVGKHRDDEFLYERKLADQNTGG